MYIKPWLDLLVCIENWKNDAKIQFQMSKVLESVHQIQEDFKGKNLKEMDKSLDDTIQYI